MRIRGAGLIVVFGLCGLAANALAQGALRVIVLNGDPVPGSPSGTTFANMGSPVINARGDVAFYSTTSLGSSSNGIWTNAGGPLRLVALAGSPAPGIAGATLGPFNSARFMLSDDGGGTGTGPARVSFQNTLSTIVATIYIDDGAALTPVARDGGAAPGSPAGTFQGFAGSSTIIHTNASGRVVFRAAYNASGFSGIVGLWHGATTGLGMIARTELTTTTAGFTNFGNPLINDSNVHAMNATLRDAGGASRPGIYAGEPFALQLRVASGTQAAGLPQGATYVTLSQIGSFNNNGQIVFLSTLAGGGVTGANDTAAFVSGPAGTYLVAREGDQVAPDVFLSDLTTIARTPVISDSGHVALYTNLNGPGVSSDNNRALLLKQPGSGGALRMLARSGQIMPGFGSTSVLDSFPSDLAMNRLGQVVFTGSLLGSDGGTGLFATDQAGRLVLVVRTNETATLRPGLTARFSTPSAPFSGGGGDGKQRSVSDSGEVVFRAGWTRIDNLLSGEGVFVARIPCGGTGGANCCDDIDFNRNEVFPEDADVIDFFNVLAGADCPACNDIDFNNNNVFPEDADVIDFFNVLAGGACGA